jgi:multiple sugar transport system substrate-binding protein
MRSISRLLSVLVTLTLSALGVMGCAPALAPAPAEAPAAAPTEAPTPREAVVELEFSSWQWMEPGRADVWRSLIQKFMEEHPNIKVKEGGVPYPRYEETLLTRMAGGEAPDVLLTSDAFFFTF